MAEKLKGFSMFDGVGGFVVGLNDANKSLGKNTFETLYTNQYEPSRKVQDAFEVGVYNFPEINHSNEDIMKTSDDYFKEIKKAGVNLICGGFPCQDYSVSHSLSTAKGIEGKKGVLFWEIVRAVKHIQPKYLILENVDRLLKSPAKQRGRDFAIMLGSFHQLGYSVEWRIINAAEYGEAQRRRRTFFFVYRNDLPFAKHIDELYSRLEDNAAKYDEYIYADGLFARQFPVERMMNKGRSYSRKLSELDYTTNEYIQDISDNFADKFWNSGIMRNGVYYTIDTIPRFEEPTTLGEVVEQARAYYDDKYGSGAYEEYLQNYIITDAAKLEKFKYLRGPKKIERTTAEGHKYMYSEGGMSETDSLDLPARTMLTSESSVNRSTHFLKHGDSYRLITPIEAELLQDFPPEWTKYKKQANGTIVPVSDKMRYFFMGNALVTGIIKRIGIELNQIEEEFK